MAGELVRPLLHVLTHAPLARFHYADEARGVPFDRAGDLAGEAARISLIVQPHVIDRPSGIAQFLGEVPHGGEDQGDLLLVMLDVGRLVPDLHHQDDGIVLGPPADRGKIARQLVAKDGHEYGVVAWAGHCVSNARPLRKCLRAWRFLPSPRRNLRRSHRGRNRPSRRVRSGDRRYR